MTMEPSTSESEPMMIKVTPEMLANTPYSIPTGCPVNTLPPELLAQIFLLGSKMQVEDEEDEDEDDDWDGINVHVQHDSISLSAWSDEEDVDPEGLDAAVVAKLRSKGKVVEGADGVMDVDAEDDEDDEDDDDDDDDGPTIQFQVLVSHVCRQWREVALETPTLWTSLDFLEGAPFEKSKIWIQRAKGSPLDIHLDCAVHEDEDHVDDIDEEGHPIERPAFNPDEHSTRYVSEHADCAHPPPLLSISDLQKIMDILVPVVAQWRSFEITTGYWEYMHVVLTRLSQCPPAPLLETLEFYHYEEFEDYDEFKPAELKGPFRIFQGEAPSLRNVALWGVHLDWDRSVSLLSNLDDLELTYHPGDVRPSYQTFTQIITASPNLRTLSLSLSGPQEHDTENNNWGSPQDFISIPSLRDFVFAFHKAPYAIALLERLSLPNVHSLALDFDGEDYSDFAKQLSSPMPGTSKSLLAGLQHLKISGLPCNKSVATLMLVQLANLKTFNINCSNEEEREMFMLLHPQKAGSGSGLSSSAQRIFCPSLQSVTTSAISGSEMRAFVEARKAAGVPIKAVMMSDEDVIDDKDLKWLREHVEEFDFFEPSDEEFEEEDFDDFSEDEDAIMSDPNQF